MDYDYSHPDWQLMQKCNKYAKMLFPYNVNDQHTWAEHCFHASKRRNVTPNQLMLERSPNINSTHRQRPVKPYYY